MSKELKYFTVQSFVTIDNGKSTKLERSNNPTWDSNTYLVDFINKSSIRKEDIVTVAYSDAGVTIYYYG